MVANLMGQIAKFFSGKSGANALLQGYAKFGKEAVNNYFKNRTSTTKFNFDLLKKKVKDLETKKDGGMVKKSSKSSTKRRAGAAKRGFNNFKGIF